MARTDTRSYLRRVTLALTLLVAVATARSASADTLTLMWDFNSEPDVNGYVVYIGTQPGVYSQTVDVHNVNTYTFASAVPGQRYFFAVAAYAGPLVSALSAEVSGVLTQAQNTPPTLVNPGAMSSNVGQSVLVPLQGADAEGDPLVYSASGLPAGLQLATSTGRITGTPTTASLYTVTATVSDGRAAVSQSFLWTIRAGSSQNTGSTSSNEDPLTGLHASSSAAYTGTSAAVRPPSASEPIRTVLRSPTQPGAGSGSTGAPVVYTGRTAITRSVAGGQESISAPHTGTSAMTRGGSSDGGGTGGLIIASGALIRSAARATSDTGALATGSDDVPALEVEPRVAIPANSAPRPSTVTAPTSAPPTVSIETPVNQATLTAGTPVIFSGTAQDIEDGNLSARIVWASSVDGYLGTGSLLTKALSPGAHVIRASVTDSHGTTRTAQVAVLVQ